MKTMVKLEKESMGTPAATVVGILTLFLLSSLFLLGVFLLAIEQCCEHQRWLAPKSFFTRLVPEAWGFFTKPADSSEYAVFTINNGSIESALGFPHSKAENWYGILRSHRAQGPEVAELTNQTKKNSGSNVTRHPLIASWQLPRNPQYRSTTHSSRPLFAAPWL